jgi:FKBP-type peptidyl-prolyl cis-trans isomerase SlyD
MRTVSSGKVVEIEYTARLADGEAADSTDGEPLAYLHGSSDLIAGLERSLEGRPEGDSFVVSIEPKDAFGDYDPELVDEMPRSAFPENAELEEGDEVSVIDEDGDESTGYIANVDGDTVYVDRNHPLAGELLTYEVTVVSIRDATTDELMHGHVHGSHAHADHGIN